MPERELDIDPELREFVALFNAGEYEASHEALMAAWERNIQYDFYKGLIQLAGAFQHWVTENAFWAEDLFASAYNLLAKYAPRHEGLDVATLIEQVRRCNEVARRARESGSVAPFVEQMPAIRLDFDPS